MGRHALAWLQRPFVSALRHRELIRVIVWRELVQRFRGSAMGWIWACVAPLVLLSAYTVVFSGAVKISSTPDEAGVVHYALSIFAALVVFNLFTELALRAPNLLHENAWFIKKTIFPSDSLAWIALLRALVYAGISLAMLVVFRVALTGSLPLTILLTPFVLAPFCFLLLGVTWLLSALGALTRDVFHFMASITPVLIFASPVFYTVREMPEGQRFYAMLNPLAAYMEMMRDVVIRGVVPELWVYAVAAAISLAVFWWGHAVFARYRSILTDVI
ncbi:MAG: ABC transporter permease [Rhodospirillaceae bacterium]|nr:ABC transporter permease [Rhodospirillaceae bacterium]